MGTEIDWSGAESAVAALLAALGQDVDDPQLRETPRRVVAALTEMLSPIAFQLTTFSNDDGYDELVVARDIPLRSLCAHHMLPFVGVAHLAYLPGGRILGLSKMARVGGPAKLIRVRYDGACVDCSTTLPVRTLVWWDRTSDTMRCRACGAGTAPAEEVEPEKPEAVAIETPSSRLARPTSVAGGSAQREFERLKAKRETGIRLRHPRLGGLILALSEDPQTTTAWAKGAVGERKLGAGLDSLVEAGVVAIHDRRIPGTKANIDHLAVTPSGVWVIDAKRYKGQVTKKDVGGLFSTDVRLYVGRRDCTKLVTAMAKQVAAVRKALGAEWTEVPVRPALCFVDAEWGWFAKPFELAGVLVTWPKAARERLARPGPYAPEGIEAIAAVLEQRLMSAT